MKASAAILRSPPAVCVELVPQIGRGTRARAAAPAMVLAPRQNGCNVFTTAIDSRSCTPLACRRLTAATSKLKPCWSWARRLKAATGLPQPVIAPAFGLGSNLQTSLIGLDEAVGFSNAEQFRIDGFHGGWNDDGSNLTGYHPAHTHLYPLWTGNSSLERAGRDAADALEYMRTFEFRPYHATNRPGGYKPGAGAQYPNGTFGNQLRNLAQMLKSPIKTGLIAAAVDHGFWDTHEGQGMPNPGTAGHWDWYGNLVEELGRGLDAFYTDLNAADLMDKVTVVVQSEFGRRFRPNASSGTDHGYANVMLAMGNRVNGGQMHGSFPGLDDLSLFQGQDVSMTTDFRQVLSEALVDRMGLPIGKVSQVFPGFGYGSSGVPNIFST